MKNRIILMTLILVTLIAAISPVYAESSSDYKNKINNANEQIDELDGQIDDALQAVEDLNSQISTVEGEITQLNTELSELEKSINEKTEELEQKKALLEERLVAMYMAGDTTYLDVVLSGGFVDFVSNYYLVSQVAEYDSNLIDEVDAIKQTLEDEKAQVEQKKQAKVDKQSSLKKLKSDKQAKVTSLNTEQQALQNQVDAWDSKMKELEEAERRAAAAAAAAEKAKANGNTSTNTSTTSDFKYDGGKLQWPVPSSTRITSYYGYRLHPIYKTYKLHSGLDIGASTGSNIVAAEEGTVLLASYGYNGGYGNYIIINHGNGLTTRYAHCKSLNVSVGQSVTKGQVIAAVGSTGDSTGPHLHFEVRINGSSTNPLEYLQ